MRHLVGLVEAMAFGSVTERLARLLLDASRAEGVVRIEGHQLQILDRAGLERESQE